MLFDDVVISAIFVSEKDFSDKINILLMKVKKEGYVVERIENKEKGQRHLWKNPGGFLNESLRMWQKIYNAIQKLHKCFIIIPLKSSISKGIYLARFLQYSSKSAL